ncbi:MAG: hypothetical protein LBJ92_02735 [Holosporales bacterium]|jgi:hypothetical protein|nr:hypothetical protein [Holosporales bacterium]
MNNGNRINKIAIATMVGILSSGATLASKTVSTLHPAGSRRPYPDPLYGWRENGSEGLRSFVLGNGEIVVLTLEGEAKRITGSLDPTQKLEQLVEIIMSFDLLNRILYKWWFHVMSLLRIALTPHIDQVVVNSEESVRGFLTGCESVRIKIPSLPDDPKYWIITSQDPTERTKKIVSYCYESEEDLYNMRQQLINLGEKEG